MVLAMKHVRAIHSGGGNADPDLSGPRIRDRSLFGAKHLRTAEIGKSENYHRETPWTAVMDAYH
jgi:hypothetical protein